MKLYVGLVAALCAVVSPASAAVVTFDMKLERTGREIGCAGSLFTDDGSCTGVADQTVDMLGYLNHAGRTLFTVTADLSEGRMPTISCLVRGVDRCQLMSYITAEMNNGVFTASLYEIGGETAMHILRNEDGTGSVVGSFFEYGDGWTYRSTAQIIPNPLPAPALLLLTGVAAMGGLRRMRKTR